MDLIHRYDILNQSFNPNRMILDMISHIGWNMEEFVDACADYSPEMDNYDWHRVIRNLWLQTFSRIRSCFDLKYRFRYYNDWKNLVVFCLAVHRILLNNPTTTEMARQEEVGDISLLRPNLMPSEKIEEDIIVAITNLLSRLLSYLVGDTEEVYRQICSMREEVAEDNRIAEARRAANRLKKQQKKKNKKNRK